LWVVKTRGLVKFFGDVVALDGLDLRVPKGVCGFIGPNGAGKTTTIHILLGLLKADRGEAYVFGLDCWENSYEIRRRVGVLLENPGYPKGFTAERYLEFIAKMYEVNQPKSKVKGLLKDVDLLWARNRKIGEFSAGMLQRLGLAKALIGEPELVILDEPTANLDPIGRLELMEKIRELWRDRGINFFISSHILPELEEICTWASIINEGTIVDQGFVTELAKKYEPYVYELEVEGDRDVFIKRLSELNFVEEVLVEGNKIVCKVKDVNIFCKEIPQIVAEFALTLRKFQPSYGVLMGIYRRLIKNEKSN